MIFLRDLCLTVRQDKLRMDKFKKIKVPEGYQKTMTPMVIYK
jgi:hypothetical protein